MQLEAVKLKEAVYTTDLAADDAFIGVGEFEDATQTVVRALGKEYGIEVVFGGTQAGNNGKVVILPAQDSSKIMTRKQYAVAQGFANQEALHCLCTDVPLFEREKERLKAAKKPLTAAYADAIEDLRIERAGQTLYPGMPSQLGATADYIARRVLDDHIKGNPEILEDLKVIGPTALGWRGRQRMGNSTPAIDEAMSMMSADNIAQLDQWYDAISKLKTGAKRPGDFDKTVSKKTTKDVLELAYRISEETILPPDSGGGEGEGGRTGGDEDKKDDKGKGKKGGQKGDKGEEEGQSDGKEGQDEGEGQEGDDDSEEGEGKKQGGGEGEEDDDKKPVEKRPGGHGAVPPTEPEPLPLDTKGMLKELLREGDNDKASAAMRPVTTCLDLVATRDTKSRQVQNVLNDPEGHKLYAKISEGISGKLAVMKRKFERALLTAQDVDYVSGQRRGKLDVRRKGVQIMGGQEAVYRNKTEGKDIDTAVTILVDASGSMGGGKMHLATKVCTALAECLNQTPVKLEILCFDTSRVSDAFHKNVYEAFGEIHKTAYSDFQNGGGNLFHRSDSITTWVIKSFEDSLRESRISLGNMMRFGFSANADGDSILEATKRLMKVKTKKRILLVLSDGQPAYNTWSGSQFDHTKKCVQKATKQGIHVVGIGIQSDAVKSFYPKYTVVHDINDLDKAVMDKLAKLILGGGFKIDNADVGKAA